MPPSPPSTDLDLPAGDLPPLPIAVVTGASSGIGAATARRLAEAGFGLVLGARRMDRLREVAEATGGRALPLDVSDAASVERFAAQVPRCDLLVNNAGAALGLDRVETAREDLWRRMFETNVLGVLRVTRALLPRLRRSGRGQIIVVGSTSGFETYPGGAGYTASKHALRAVTRTLRLELLGEPIKVAEINPGLVETEFSLVRHGGDAERAGAVYRGMTPLVGDDVARAIAWVAAQPPHVNVDELVLRPLDQAAALTVHRREV